MLQAPMNQPNRSSFDGPVAIFWDIKNCRVPRDVRPEDVAGNIIVALQGHPLIKGAVTTFSAYGDFTAFPRQLREGCQRTGVRLIDVPNGRKDDAKKDIFVDMILFARDNPPPSSIMLISGDVDFAPALHRLGRRGCIVILVIPSGVDVSSALSNAGKFVWDWPSVARGKANLGAAGNCETMLSERKITLKSSDGETFEVDEAVALESQIIKHMIEVDCVDNGIPLPNVTSKILAKVIEYCKKHVEAEPDDDSAATTSTPTSTDEDIKAWDADFVNVDQTTLFDLILAANYLNIKNLLDLTCQTVADMIKGKTPEEIRKTFNLNGKDFTPEEEEQVRRENPWAFE